MSPLDLFPLNMSVLRGFFLRASNAKPRSNVQITLGIRQILTISPTGSKRGTHHLWHSEFFGHG